MLHGRCAQPSKLQSESEEQLFAHVVIAVVGGCEMGVHDVAGKDAYVPVGQDEQFVAPGDGAKVPASHGLHAPSPRYCKPLAL